MSDGCCMADLGDGASGLCDRPVDRVVAAAVVDKGDRPVAVVLGACAVHAPALERWLGPAVCRPVDGALIEPELVLT